ncbi:hypothetical protein VNI00_016770 [Paramarasmius palmivorus]|uniref:Uncharacterized protein n=1 Tax=Paramarasmius palmivorus TaxID=297713 RepID=A0AAW0BAY6_9AGAR
MQPLFSDTEGTPLEIQNDFIRKEASHLREYLSRVHWHSGSVRYHQDRVNYHLERVDCAITEAEEALGRLLNHLSACSPGDASDSERRESFATAVSRPPSTETTYTDESYDNMVRTVSLTPEGHVQPSPPIEFEATTNQHLDKGVQTAPVVAGNRTHSASPSTRSNESLIQTFSRSSPLHPFSYSASRSKRSPAQEASRLVGFASSMSEPGAPTTKSPKKASAQPVSAVPISAASVNLSPSKSKGKAKETGKVYLVLNGKGNVHQVHLEQSKAKAAKATGTSVLTFDDYNEAQMALNGCIQSKLVQYLGDPAYQTMWFAVLKGNKPTVCQSDALLKSIGRDHLKHMKETDIVPAPDEDEANLIYEDNMGLYEDD